MRGKSPPTRTKNNRVSFKAVLLIVIACIVGLLFLALGAAEYIQSGLYEAFPYLLVGVLVIAPVTIYIVLFLAARKRWPGYTYDMKADLD